MKDLKTIDQEKKKIRKILLDKRLPSLEKTIDMIYSQIQQAREEVLRDVLKDLEFKDALVIREIKQNALKLGVKI